ncbi:MAG: AgmX/PglI C-terminal domain-containing protein [Deltaproteobacteria bacterium]|nr:MAG: AgmX/PglI C-terminal domain-containing protein [Deltaproteobacteria bacterium]
MIPIVLKVYDGGKLRASRSFLAERIQMGSGPADLVLDAPSVAPSHAVIEIAQGGVILRAVGAAPVYLNGQPILAAPLRHGDLISIGELRIMVELQKAAPASSPMRRPRLQLITGSGEEQPKFDSAHAQPSLQVVREDVAQPSALGAESDQGLHARAESDLGLHVLEPEMPAPAAAPAVVENAALALPEEEPPPPPAQALPPLPETATQGGECAEVELFWHDTRLSVWQLQPGEKFVAGTDPGCHALLSGVDRAVVLRSDVNGWTVAVPRPLSITLEEGGRTVGGPELLVRGRSQADAQGLVVPLPQRAVALLSSGELALRIRRVRSAARAGSERTDWKGVLVASLAALAMMFGLRLWSNSVPVKTVGEPELIKSRPLAVRSVIKPVEAPIKKTEQNQGRKDPGQAVARHMGPEGQAGTKTAPRRDARAERKMDDRALLAQTGLLKALGAGKGTNDVFGVALEKGTVDAMGHLTGPRVGDARGDGGMGLKSLGGKGGGGDGSGLGLARIGTNGIGGGFANYGDGKGGLHGKEDGDIGLGPGKPQVVGQIDPELIRKVVHDHRAQIRTCYETQLNTRPTLAGKLVSAWTIDPSGVVTEAHTQESTLHDHAVEQCVASKIKTWRFPIPKGGGEVFVTYPFIFTPGG